MQIENIVIENFRNIEYSNITFGENINLIIGSNAQGKTNLIEALYYVAFLKSFRTQKNNDLLKEYKSTANLKCNVLNGGVDNLLQIKFGKKNKEININKKKPEKKDLFKYLNIILFHPDEVNYITSYPHFRRNLIDRSIFFTDFEYINTFKNYARCLKQRNTFIKSNSSDLDCWEDQLVIYGSEIIRKRLEYINKINNYFLINLKNQNNKEEYSLSYSKKYPDFHLIEENLKEEFERKRERERILGYTLAGPHRDDLQFYLNGKPAEIFASQGQKRSLLISYKTAQILDYKAIRGHYPVLLLDDMTSELDSNRKNILLENLLNNSGQVFITSTDFKKNKISEQSKRFRVNNGEISSAD